MQFNELAKLAALAWHETKAENDPEFGQCDVTHREKLVAAVQGVVGTNQAFNRFDAVVLRLHREAQEEKSRTEQLVDAHPNAHADEIMHMAAGVPHPLQGHAEQRQMAAVREEFRGAEPFADLPIVFDDAPQVSEEATAKKKKTTHKKSSK